MINDKIYSITRSKSLKKDKQVKVLKEVLVRNRELGTTEKRWLVENTLKAYVRQVGMIDGETANVDNIDFADYFFLINYREGLDPEKHQLYYKGKRYRIKKIDYFEDNKRKDIVLIGTTNLTVPSAT